MGNLPFLPVDTREELNNLYLEFGYLKEYGVPIKNSRISYNYKVIAHEKKSCEVYRFFNGIIKYIAENENFKEGNCSTDRIESSNSLTDQNSFSFDEIVIRSELKYYPSLNGIAINKPYNVDSIKDLINCIVNSIENQSNLVRTNYCPNIVFYDYVNNKNNFLYIKRPMWESTIKDQFGELMTEIESLDEIIKQWLEFQCIISLVQLHCLKIFHGDIKTENMLLNHLLIVKLTDISPWKPIFIDNSDLRYWTIFFETEEQNNNYISRCNLPPERFLSKRRVEEENLQTYENNMKDPNFCKKLQSMDIFSLGCVLSEIDNNGMITFTINDILRMSVNQEQPSKIGLQKDWIEMMTNLNCEKRPTAMQLLLFLLNMEAKFDEDINMFVYIFSNASKKSDKTVFNKSFPLFFYPLSILLQSELYCDIRVQLIILNLALCSFLELFILEDIQYNSNKKNIDLKDKFLDKRESKQLDLYIEIFSNINMKYKDHWDNLRLIKIVRSKFDYELMKDMIFYIVMMNLEQFNIEKDIKFDQINNCFNNVKNNSKSMYLSLKGLFSLFQFLVLHWNSSKVTYEFENHPNLGLNEIINMILIQNLNNDLFLNEVNIDIPSERKYFFDFVNQKKSFVENIDLSTMLYINMILNCLIKLNQTNEYKQIENQLIELELYHNIYLITINSLDILVETLSKDSKKEILIKKILPVLVSYLLKKENQSDELKQNFQNDKNIEIKETNNSINLYDSSDRLSVNYKVFKKDKIVTFEILNFLNKHILKYIQNPDLEVVDKEINLMLNFFIVKNIEEWLYDHILSNDSQIVDLLLLMIRKILTLIMNNNNDETNLKKWAIEILKSRNAILKLSLLKNMGYETPLLVEILNYYIINRKHDKFISEILPYLLDQLNDENICVRSGYCELIISILEKMNIILILPYGQFCIEKCLNDNDLKLKFTGLKCINAIIKRILFYIKSNFKFNINDHEKIITELIESFTNNIKNINLLKKYYPFYSEFVYLIYNLIEVSRLLNNWAMIYILLDNYFDIKKISIDSLLKLLEIRNRTNENHNEFIIYYFFRFLKNEFKRKEDLNKESFKTELPSKNYNNEDCDEYEIESYYTSINLITMPCIASKMNIKEHFNNIIYHSSQIQVESKYKLRKQIMEEKLSNLFKNIYHRLENNPENQHILEKKKYIPPLQGKYLGSIYNHQKLLDEDKNDTLIGNGHNIYQRISYYYKDVYSWSVNSSINSGIYLHRLNTGIFEKAHHWNLIINNNENNYIFKFDNNRYITSMISLSDEFSIITGDNKGLLTKVNLRFDNNLIDSQEYHYNDERNIFSRKYDLKLSNPIVTLLGKLRIHFKEMIMSIYSNGDVYIFDTNYISIDLSFTIPPHLGKVIDYCIDNNHYNTDWICLVTDINVVIVINLFYLRKPKIWKISCHNELKITNVRNVYLNNKEQSTSVMLIFNKIGFFRLLNWKNGHINVRDNDLLFNIREIDQKLLYIHYPHLYSSKILHFSDPNINGFCNCTYCQIERIRIFGNFLNQYLYFKNCNLIENSCKYIFNQNVIGPISSFGKNHEYENNQSCKFYIFNDDSGNFYQQKYLTSDFGENLDNFPPVCIISNYSENINASSKTGTVPGHKDIITSSNIYYYNEDNNIGLITSSRDGIISYWN